MSGIKSEVAIVGGGFAGVCAAHALARNGISGVLVDRSETFPDQLRAEKIEPDQAALLRKIGVLSLRSPVAGPIGEILNVRGHSATACDTIEQYGISYAETVNQLRRHLPAAWELRIGAVSALTPRPVGPSLTLVDGTELTARLVLVASGGSDRLMGSLGLSRRHDPSLRSLTYGFDLDWPERWKCEVKGLNFFPGRNAAKIDYLTLFPIGDRFRANLFTQQDPRDPVVSTIRQDVRGSLRKLIPELDDYLRQWRVVSRVQVVPTSYYRLVGAHRLAGIAVVGEEFQSVSPTTGLGLTKVLTDVDVLCSRYVPQWLADGRLGAARIRSYYRDDAKRRADRRALSSWMHYRDLGVDRRLGLLDRVRQRLRLAQ